MAQEVEQFPSAFQKTLQAIYAGELIVPRCHQADDIRANLRTAILLRSPEAIWIDDLTQEFISGGVVQARLGEMEVTYRAMMRINHIRKKRRFLPDKKIPQTNFDTSPINIAINGVWGTPAAIVLPARTPDASAEVVVGDKVNDPEHLREISKISKLLATADTHKLPA